MLPDHVRARLSELLDGVSRNELAERARRLSEGYRSGRPSSDVVRTDLDALAYVVARLPATYAAVAKALAQWSSREAGLAPASVLDLGAGPGSASLAACEIFPSVESVTQIEINPRFRALAQVIGDLPGRAPTCRMAGDLTEGVGGEAWPDADLALLTYVLVELTETAALQVVGRAFERCRNGLVLVEPGTPKGFEALRRARAALIDRGAHVLAPCPGDGACPMAGQDWCHFTVRLPRLKDHRLVKGADVPFEDERFSYLVVGRLPSASPGNRVLAAPDVSRGSVALKLCTPSGLQRREIMRSDKAGYKLARRIDWGDALASE